MTRPNATPIALCLFSVFTVSAYAQRLIPPYDLWTDTVMGQVRDKSTLEISVEPQFGYAEVYFTSNPSANFFDAKAPYAEHTNEKIRIHGYLAYPSIGGPYPALVIGHGHGGKADLSFAQLVASLGVVALAIDGPQAGKSTGGPADDVQAWISVDKGADYSYLYHYTYAGMRALTLLEALAAQSDNPFRIDATKLGVFGVSMGGMLASYMNGIDNRLMTAIVVASAGNWPHVLRIPNSWLYHDLYTGTRDLPYNGSDPINSIEDIDSDATAISFLNHFDPIRYTPRQYAPVITLIGTHDQYFPLPNANLMQLATASAGYQFGFEKRLWLIPNAGHGTFSSVNLLSLASGLRQWLDYCMGKRQRPLATPQIGLTETEDGLSFDIAAAETTSRLAGSSVELFAATRIDSTGTQITDFKSYVATQDGSHFTISIPAGEKSVSGDTYSVQNIIYFATLTDSLGLPVSSLAYKGKLPMDLSTDFVPVIEHSPDDQISVPQPPAPADAIRTFASSNPLGYDASYQGMALTNPTDSPMAVRIEARTAAGRLAAAEGLINPSYMTIQPRTEQIFLAEEWLGSGARLINGSFQVGWSNKRGTSLAFRGNSGPSQLEAIGPATAAATTLWLPFVPEQDGYYTRRLRFFSGSGTDTAVTLTLRTRVGEVLYSGQVNVPAWGTSELPVTVGSDVAEIASAQIDAPAPIAARIEVGPYGDTWSIDAVPAPAGTKFIQPHAEWNGTYKTRFILVNTSSSSRTVRFLRHVPAGQVVSREISVFMDKNQTASLPLETLFSVPSSEGPGAGWIEAESSGGEVLIFALANDPARYSTAVSPLGPGNAGNLSMPYFVESPDYWTGLALANGGSVDATADIVAYSYTGEVLGRSKVSLYAGQSKTQLVHEWISGLPSEARGQIVITTSGAIALLAYFGTVDGASLAAIPFTPIAP